MVGINLSSATTATDWDYGDKAGIMVTKGLDESHQPKLADGGHNGLESEAFGWLTSARHDAHLTITPDLEPQGDLDLRESRQSFRQLEHSSP